MRFTSNSNIGLQLALAGVQLLIQSGAVPQGIKLAAALSHAGIAALSSLFAHKHNPQTGKLEPGPPVPQPPPAD